jgi:carbon-monoxide dehydrogenase medium subunit
MIDMSIYAQSVLPEFEYIKPKTLGEASRFLADHTGEARPFLGGTDTFVRMRDGVWKDAYLVDVKGLDGTGELKYSASKGLTIGAAVSMNRVSAFPDVKKHYPLLAEVVNSVASYQLRTRATIVGNICNASPAGDTIGACLLYGGVLNVHGVKGERVEPLATFFVSPGKTMLKPGDIVTSIELPAPPKGHTGVYLKHGRNKLGDLALVGVTVVAYPDKGTESEYCFKLALASVAPTPLIVEEVETILGEEVTEVRIAEAAQAAMDSCNPIDDVRSSAKYRKMMVRNLSQNALSQVWAKLKK